MSSWINDATSVGEEAIIKAVEADPRDNEGYEADWLDVMVLDRLDQLRLKLKAALLDEDAAFPAQDVVC